MLMESPWLAYSLLQIMFLIDAFDNALDDPYPGMGGRLGMGFFSFKDNFPQSANRRNELQIWNIP